MSLHRDSLKAGQKQGREIVLNKGIQGKNNGEKRSEKLD